MEAVQSNFLCCCRGRTRAKGNGPDGGAERERVTEGGRDDRKRSVDGCNGIRVVRRECSRKCHPSTWQGGAQDLRWIERWKKCDRNRQRCRRKGTIWRQDIRLKGEWHVDEEAGRKHNRLENWWKGGIQSYYCSYCETGLLQLRIIAFLFAAIATYSTFFRQDQMEQEHFAGWWLLEWKDNTSWKEELLR